MNQPRSSFEGEGGFDFTSLFRSDYDVDGAIYGVHVGYNFQRDNLVSAPNSA